MVDRSWDMSCRVSRSTCTVCVPSMNGRFIQLLFWLWTSILSMVTSSFDSCTGASLMDTVRVPRVTGFCVLLGRCTPEVEIAAIIMMAAAIPAITYMLNFFVFIAILYHQLSLMLSLDLRQCI